MPRLFHALLIAAVGVGCGRDRGDKPVDIPEQQYIQASDQTLPVGVVGKPYEAVLTAAGGTPPYSWRVEGEGLPMGLTLDPDGHVQGVPAEAGDFVFSVVVADSAGRSQRLIVTIDVVLEPAVLRCGEKASGRFAGNAFKPGGPDLTDLDNLAWLAIEMPDDLTTRIELRFTSNGVSTLYVERPSEPLGSSNFDDHYVAYYLNADFTDMTVMLDAGTVPSLTGYLTQPLLPMLLVGQSAGDWEMEVVCTDGPVFVDLPQYPTELGQPLEIDFDVYGDNTGVRIFTEDPLPDWMVWDEATGTVSGTAMEPGAWEFTVVAEAADGRRREDRSIIGVYEVLPLGCGQSVPLETSEGYFDGEFYSYYDPRGYAVYRVSLDEAQAEVTSAITLHVEGSDGHYLGLAEPDPGWLNFYGGAERVYLNLPEADLVVDPRSYPASRHYLDGGELYFSAGSIGSGLSMSVSVTCDDQPRPDLAGMPVIPAIGEAAFDLPAIGGSPPYLWSAAGLPAGLVLDRDGHLHGSAAVGTYGVQLTVEDRLGASSTDTYDLHVGTDAACAGYRPVSCGDSIDGRFSEAYYNDGNGTGSTEVLCIVPDDRWLGYEIYSDDGELRVDIPDPGVSADEMFAGTRGTFVAWVDRDSTEGVPVDPFSWPSITDYPDLPVLLAVRAYEPGDWTVHLVCP